MIRDTILLFFPNARGAKLPAERNERRIGPGMTRTIGRMTIAMLVVTCVAPFVAYHLASGVAIGTLEGQLQRSLFLTNRAIETEIERFRYLPMVVGEDARIRARAGPERGEAALVAANAYLKTIVRQSCPAELYVRDAHVLPLRRATMRRRKALSGRTTVSAPISAMRCAKERAATTPSA